jgi:effector-binding domain-containing protein
MSEHPMDVTLTQIAPRLIAAVRRTAAPRQVSTVFRPALDQVWAFLRAHPGLRTDGHNVFLYHHVARPDDGMPVDFGVEVTRRFEPEGLVRCVETPAGEAAVVMHRGPYSALAEAHAALHRWCAAHERTIGDASLEIYGDWSDDPERLETTIQYLLK